MSARVERPAGADGTLTGIGVLTAFFVRIDRIRLTLWVLGIGLVTVATAASFPGIYPDAAARQTRATLIASNPATIALSGPGYGLDDYTFGAMMTNEMLGMTCVLVAIMASLLVVRRTRGDEEAGRAELVRAGIVGRHASGGAALIVGVGASLAVGLLCALGLGMLGMESIDWTGSLLYGAALAGTGITFAAIGLAVAQVTEHARTASGLAGLFIAAAYALRAVGDVGNGVLSWLSPIGWAQATRAYVDDLWWPLLLFPASAAVLALVALALNNRRDLGAGLIQPRPGPATGSARLGTPLGLAVRLQRGAFVGWLLALVAFGGIYGTLLGEVQDFAADNPVVQNMLPDAAEGVLLDSFVALIVGLIAMVATVFGVQVVSRILSEESSGHAESILATAVSRVSWAGAFIIVAIVGSAIVVLATGLVFGLVGAASVGDGSMVGGALGAAACNVPAVWVVIGFATALAGLAPRAMALSWILVFWVVFAGMFGGLLQLPDWAIDLSPFGHVPLVPAEAMQWGPVVVLTVLALVLVAIGLVGLRRRDLTSAT